MGNYTLIHYAGKYSAKMTKETSNQAFTVVIVGGGLVGSLAAVMFAKRGWQVELYEMRKGKHVRLCFSIERTGPRDAHAHSVVDQILELKRWPTADPSI